MIWIAISHMNGDFVGFSVKDELESRDAWKPLVLLAKFSHNDEFNQEW